MAYERLVRKLTKENLWLYILKMLQERPDYPLGLKRRFREKFNFEPAGITFYTVLYRLKNEGLVASKNEGGRTVYLCTQKGEQALRLAVDYLKTTSQKLES
ncbi:MAG: PadR family transcriptional regulator [Conexivisphaerales archaeon]